MKTATNQAYTLEIYERDPMLQEAFRVAGGGSISDTELAAIGQHRHTLYCLTKELSLESARRMLRVGTALLNAGGVAVKVESTGLAHNAIRWRALSASESTFDTYNAFVTLVGNKECFYSCGMHNFGLPDSAVPRNLDSREAAKTLNILTITCWERSQPLRMAIHSASRRMLLIMNYERQFAIHTNRVMVFITPSACGG